LIEVKRLAALLIALVCLALPAVSPAATFTVDTTADTAAAECGIVGAPCSLRGALVGATEVAGAENTVIVPAGTYALALGELKINTFEGGTVRIVGSGARKTVIDAGGASRVLGTNADSTVLEGLTLTGGAATEVLGEELAGDGGGLLLGTSAEDAVLRDVTISGNTAMLNGGGIAAPPEGATGKALTVERSTISGNRVSGGAVEALGGGVYVLGELTMVNSTVVGNVAESAVGAQEGGGILSGPATTEVATTSTAIVNSTIAGNSVGVGGTGGGISIYSPGGLIEPTSTLTNTVIAGNKAGEAGANCGPLTITSKNDLSSDASCMFTDAASKKATDPKLGPLADNGGETDTLALLAGSPAIDAGTAEGCPATDQRGVSRPLGSACDIGAYEYTPTPASTPPATKGPTAGNATSADLRLKIKPRSKKTRRGKRIAFLATVRNLGPDAATRVVFKGTVPAATGRVRIKGLGKKACVLGKPKKAKRALTCQLGTIDAGKSLSFRIPIKRKKAPRKLVIRAAVTSSVADPTPADARVKVKAKRAAKPKA
jgi:Domain of unknown function DUF11